MWLVVQLNGFVCDNYYFKSDIVCNMFNKDCGEDMSVGSAKLQPTPVYMKRMTDCTPWMFCAV